LVFGSHGAYFAGDLRAVAAKPPTVEAHEFHAKAYMDLILSPGRNEPDDRVFSIEVVSSEQVPLAGALLAIALPHTLSNAGVRAPWLQSLAKSGVDMIPYEFLPGRPPQHYQTLVEQAVKAYYERKGYL
jgi:hypothetical protein